MIPRWDKKLKFSKGLLSATLALTLGACATGDRTYGADADISVTNLTELPVPAVSYARIGPALPLQIAVVGDEALNGTYVTDEAGNITFPYIGEISAIGLTPTQFASVLRARLDGDYLVDPAVTVTVEDASVPTISMGGEIARPGNYPAAQSYTLLRAVNTAGGMAEYADHEDVLVFRDVDGQRYIGLYNLAAIARGNYPDPAVFGGDIVMVGDNASRRRLERILGLLPALSSSVLLVDRIGN